MQTRSALLFAVLVSCAFQAAATFQEHERIEVSGIDRDLRNIPLDTWLKSKGFELPRGIWSTGNSRGYVAHWALRDGRLYLDRIVVTRSRLDDDEKPPEDPRVIRARRDKLYQILMEGKECPF